MMTRKRTVRSLSATLLASLALAGCAQAKAADPEMTVYATPTCGCCGAWVDHMREAGFTVRVVFRNDLGPVRLEHRLPPGLVSCHTGVVDGYAVEGHVPADVVRRLLTEKPAVLGVAVPGMPVGSPGMEHPTGFAEPYNVYTYDSSGRAAVYARVN
jgi:hypothetical protein